MRVDAERVSSEVALIDADVPGCHAAPTDAAARTAMRAGGARLRDLVEAMRLVARARGESSGVTTYAGGIGTNGPCGGNVVVDYLHESGVTDYEVDLDAFCLDTEDGPVVLDGKLVGKETGTPSDFGPVISKFEVSSDGALEVTHAGETTRVTITDAKTEYGVPSEFEPGFPTEQAPDRTTIASVSAVFPSGRESFLRKLEIERSGGIEMVIRVVEGELGTEGEGYVEVQTVEGEPIESLYNDGAVSGGAVQLTGRGGVVVVRQNPDDPDAFELTLDGAPVADSVDCGSAVGARRDAVAALIQALPIY